MVLVFNDMYIIEKGKCCSMKFEHLGNIYCNLVFKKLRSLNARVVWLSETCVDTYQRNSKQ